MKTNIPRNSRHLPVRALLFSLLIAIVICAPTTASALCEKDSYCCSAGSRDGAQCNFDSDCSGGACVFVQNICVSGSADGDPYCTSDSDCPGGTCVGAQKVCVAGDYKGYPCLRAEQCPGGACNANAMFCFGGDYDRFPCADSADCAASGGTSGTCRLPAAATGQFSLCSAGINNGGTCTTNADCPNGVCVLAQNVCLGGSDFVNGYFCTADTDCEPGVTCGPTQRICTSGDNKGYGCLRDANCTPGGSCVASGRVCEDVSEYAGSSCNDDADCGASGVCSPPLTGTTPTRTPGGNATPTRTPGGNATPTATPIFSRRPTPSFTPTRTHTPGGNPSTPISTATQGSGGAPTPCATTTDGICVETHKSSGCSTGGGDRGGVLIVAGFLLLWSCTRRKRAV